MPRISDRIAVSTRIAIRLPPESTSTTSASADPTPVWLTAPTMMPAVAVAMPMPIMLRAPATRPSIRSMTPARVSAPMFPVPRKIAMIGRCVTRMKIMKDAAQKAERPGLRRSTISAQTSTTTGRMKCRPERTVGPGRGSLVTGALGSSIFSGASREATHRRAI